MRRLACLILCLLFAGPLSAQVIIGTVTDSTTGTPLADIAVSVEDSTGILLAEVRTGEKGEFLLDGHSAISMRFVVRKIGALPSYSQFYSFPEAADTLKVDLVAPQVGAMLATVTIVARDPRTTFNGRQLINAKESGWHVAEPWQVARSRQSASDFEHLVRRAAIPGVLMPRGSNGCFTNARNRRCLTIVIDGLVLDPWAYVNPQTVYFLAYIPANSALVLYGWRAREGALFVATRRPGDDESRPRNDEAEPM